MLDNLLFSFDSRHCISRAQVVFLLLVHFIYMYIYMYQLSYVINYEVFYVLIFCLLGLSWVEGGKNKDTCYHSVNLFFSVFTAVLYEIGC